jgi:hypothetical protein
MRHFPEFSLYRSVRLPESFRGRLLLRRRLEVDLSRDDSDRYMIFFVYLSSHQ